MCRALLPYIFKFGIYRKSESERPISIHVHGKVAVPATSSATGDGWRPVPMGSQHQHPKRYRIWSFCTSPYLLNVMSVASLLGSTSALWVLARRHRDPATGYGPPSLHGIPSFGDFSLGYSASGRFSGHIVISPLPNSLTHTDTGVHVQQV